MKTQGCTLIAILGLSASHLAKYSSLQISRITRIFAEVYGGPKENFPKISTLLHDAIEVSEVCSFMSRSLSTVVDGAYF